MLLFSNYYSHYFSSMFNPVVLGPPDVTACKRRWALAKYPNFASKGTHQSSLNDKAKRIKGLILHNPDRVSSKQTPAARSVHAPWEVQSQPRGSLTSARPCSHPAPRRLASMFGLRSCRLRWAPLSKYSHSFGCSPESQTWNRDLSHSLPVGSVLRCPPPVRKRERVRERARALERKRERDGKEFGNQDRSLCHQNAKWKQKARRLFCAADNVSCEQLVRSSRSHIKCHHDLTTFLLWSSFFLIFFVGTKKKESQKWLNQEEAVSSALSIKLKWFVSLPKGINPSFDCERETKHERSSPRGLKEDPGEAVRRQTSVRSAQPELPSSLSLLHPLHQFVRWHYSSIQQKLIGVRRYKPPAKWVCMDPPSYLLDPVAYCRRDNKTPVSCSRVKA